MDKVRKIAERLQDRYLLFGDLQGGRILVEEAHSEGSRFGFLDEHGFIAVPCIYEEAEEFLDGVALVKANGEYLFIDPIGRRAVAPEERPESYPEECGGKSTPIHSDDGQDFPSMRTLLARLEETRPKSGRLICRDFGEDHKLLRITVTDVQGQAVPEATLSVYVTHCVAPRGTWEHVPAAAPGQLRFVFPGYFGGAFRTEIYIVQAPGYRPRWLKRCQPCPPDQQIPLTEAIFDGIPPDFRVQDESLAIGIQAMAKDKPEFADPIYLCERQIILRNEALST